MPEFAVVAEGETDARMAQLLAERIFLEEGPDWIREDCTESVPEWVREHYLPKWSGLESNSTYSTWRTVKHLCTESNFRRAFGHNESGKPRGIYYAQGRNALFLLGRLRKTKPIDGLVLVVDLDHQPERRDGLTEARKEVEEAKDQVVILLATPNPKQEAWVLNGLVCEGHEAQALEALRQELGFDPCHKAEELRAKDETAKRSAHRVVKALIGESRERKEKCWTDTPLTILRERGEATYLNTYLIEVEERLLPLLTK
ncbi:MAG: hypothetical protein ACREA2_10360 [Blastocatellia bacterium]